MTFHYDEVVPWGRSFDEYRQMFQLTDEDLGRRILGCGDGPASFNCAMAARGHEVISYDPLYRLSTPEIRQRIAATFADVIAQTRQNDDKFVWDTIPTVDALGQVRMAAMDEFLADYERGKQAGRYVAGELPALPFADQEFGLALSSHFLFLYSDQLTLEFHLRAICEMVRVAQEVRIFPLLDVNANPSPHVAPVCRLLTARGKSVRVETVSYEFQKGGNRMLQIH